MTLPSRSTEEHMLACEKIGVLSPGQSIGLSRKLSGLLLLACASACGGDDAYSFDPTATTYELQDPVTITTDTEGVAHVSGKTELDVFYAQGYQQARDNLFALDVIRREGVGTLAEVFGEDGASTDFQSRTFGFRRLAERTTEHYRENEPNLYAQLVAFVSGVNRRVEEVLSSEAPMPPDYETLGFAPTSFAVADPLAIGTRYLFGLSTSLENEVLSSLLPVLGVPDSLPVFAPGTSAFYSDGASAKATPVPGSTHSKSAKLELFHGPPSEAQVAQLKEALSTLGLSFKPAGSNNWVVNRAHTANGRSLLAGDPHQPLRSPSLMSVQHVTAENGPNAIGFVFTGTPGISLGHNETMAWSATQTRPDQMDVWTVTVDSPSESERASGAVDQVQLGGSSYDTVRIEESYRVKLPDGSSEDRSVAVLEVPGYFNSLVLPPGLLPDIVSGFLPGDLLVAWPGFTSSADFRGILDLMRANSPEEMRRTIAHQRTGMQSIVFASADEIGLGSHTALPARAVGSGAPRVDRLLDGTDASTLWNGEFVADELMPRGDASRDFIATANNDPFGFTADNDLYNDEFYFGNFFDPGYRGGRIEERLQELVDASAGVTAGDMAELQNDVLSIFARNIVTSLSAIVADTDDPTVASYIADKPEVISAAQMLSEWDYRMTAESNEATLFRMFAEELRETVTAPVLGPLYSVVESAASLILDKTVALLAADPALRDQFFPVPDPDDPGAMLSYEGAFLASLDSALVRFVAAGMPRWGEVAVLSLPSANMERTEYATYGDDSTVRVSGCAFTESEQCVNGGGGSIFRFVAEFDENGTPVGRFNAPHTQADVFNGWISTNEYFPLRFDAADIAAHTADELTLMPR
jgi:penicillin amidase